MTLLPCRSVLRANETDVRCARWVLHRGRHRNGGWSWWPNTRTARR